jgi:hypothetical protein
MATTQQWQVNGANPVTVGGLGTTAKYFPQPSGNFTSGPATTPSSTNAGGQLAVHGDNQLNGQRFLLVAAGNVTAAAGTVTIEMVANTGTVATPTYTVIASTGAVTPAASPASWSLEAYVNGDTTVGKLTGYQISSISNVVVSDAALTNALSGLDFSGGSGTLNKIGALVFGVVMRVTFGTTGAANSANMYQFQLANTW